MSKNVMIRSYFSQPKGVREQKIVKQWYKQFLTLCFSRVLHCVYQSEVQTIITHHSNIDIM